MTKARVVPVQPVPTDQSLQASDHSLFAFYLVVV